MKEEELLQRRLKELADRAYSQNVYTYTHFLNEYEQNLYREMKQELSYAEPSLVGGHKHYTRAFVMFGSENMFGYPGEIPLACAKISPVFKKYAQELNHRDYLGAMMNLGIERHQIGDILVDEASAYVFGFPHIGKLLKEQLFKVRNTSVCVELVEFEDTGFVQKYLRKEGFVASMRLDVLVSMAFGVSRTASDKLLKGQKVFHNGKLSISGGQKIKQEDIISVRGYGKFLVEKLGKQSKKGRQFITLAVFQ